MKPFVAAVDWGTSSFRLWVLASDGTVLAEARSDEGMMKAISLGFPAVLDRHLGDVGAGADLPVMICGMAGARQGWREAPYLDTPAALDDLGAQAVTIDGQIRDIRILPGVAQRDPDWPDVMRGEETQLLGAIGQGTRSGLVCMPGTHAKWVELRDGVVRRFATVVTGETFAVLREHSILRLALDGQPQPEADDPVFLETVRAVYQDPALGVARLFAIRAGPLLGVRDPAQGAARLSGLLIGMELAAARARFGSIGKVQLVAAGRLEGVYRAALRAVETSVETVDADVAVRAGLLGAARTIW
ncbi:2-dehydro-3-deoxygalactonokinase [Mesorhizobium sp. CAU 1732]|uniref:2-dehydro-3-deoxygalactonokinase n=1 Tax=Mesorhizobium sp. CAU 1732 TaxID=3140358 RepID=UPI00326165BB